MSLAGCSGGSDDSSSTDPSSTSTGTKAINGTKGAKPIVNATPNLPPLLVLSVTNETGAPTTSALILEETRNKGNLTFSAVGSKDQDADGLSAVAITVSDANRTYPPGVLFAGGVFTSVTYSFDRAGPVNVTVSGIDVRGDVTTLRTNVFVNLKDSLTGVPFKLSGTTGFGGDPTECHGPTEDELVDGNMADDRKFTTERGTSFVTAKVVSGAAEIAICAPDGTAISAAGTEVTSNAGTVFAPTVGDQQYFIMVISDGFGSPTALADGNNVVVDVVVHYEAPPAAA